MNVSKMIASTKALAFFVAIFQLLNAQQTVNNKKIKNKFNDPKLVKDSGHLKEHYKGKAKVDPNEMTEKELIWHHFKVHDLDKNRLLDGLELMQAFRHTKPFEESPEYPGPMEISGTTTKVREEQRVDYRQRELDYYTELVDSALSSDDLNGDGYISYQEHVIGIEKAKNEETE